MKINFLLITLLFLCGPAVWADTLSTELSSALSKNSITDEEIKLLSVKKTFSSPSLESYKDANNTNYPRTGRIHYRGQALSDARGDEGQVISSLAHPNEPYVLSFQAFQTLQLLNQTNVGDPGLGYNSKAILTKLLSNGVNLTYSQKRQTAFSLMSLSLTESYTDDTWYDTHLNYKSVNYNEAPTDALYSSVYFPVAKIYGGTVFMMQDTSGRTTDISYVNRVKNRAWTKGSTWGQIFDNGEQITPIGILGQDLVGAFRLNQDRNVTLSEDTANAAKVKTINWALLKTNDQRILLVDGSNATCVTLDAQNIPVMCQFDNYNMTNPNSPFGQITSPIVPLPIWGWINIKSAVPKKYSQNFIISSRSMPDDLEDLVKKELNRELNLAFVKANEVQPDVIQSVKVTYLGGDFKPLPAGDSVTGVETCVKQPKCIISSKEQDENKMPSQQLILVKWNCSSLSGNYSQAVLRGSLSISCAPYTKATRKTQYAIFVTSAQYGSDVTKDVSAFCNGKDSCRYKVSRKYMTGVSEGKNSFDVKYKCVNLFSLAAAATAPEKTVHVKSPAEDQYANFGCWDEEAADQAALPAISINLLYPGQFTPANLTQ